MSSRQRALIHYFIFTWRWIHTIVIWIHSTVIWHSFPRKITLISTICHANFIVLILKFCESSYGRAFMLHLKLVSCVCRHIFSWYLDCTSFFFLLLFVHKLKTKFCIWFVDKNSSTKLDQYLASCFWPFDWYCLLSRLIQCVIWIRLCFYCSLSYKLSVVQYQFSGSWGKLMSTRFDNSKFRNIFIWVS